jgi:hypothetical protein
VQDGDRVVVLPSREMQPIEPQRLIDTYAVSAGARMLMVEHEVQLAQPPAIADTWLRVRIVRFHVVDGFGWRMSRTASIDLHEPVPSEITTNAPAGARSRLALRVTGVPGTTELPHLPR